MVNQQKRVQQDTAVVVNDMPRGCYDNCCSQRLVCNYVHVCTESYRKPLTTWACA